MDISRVPHLRGRARVSFPDTVEQLEKMKDTNSRLTAHRYENAGHWAGVSLIRDVDAERSLAHACKPLHDRTVDFDQRSEFRAFA